MKIVLTGSTGFIGSAVLDHCVTNPEITSVVALSRRPLTTTHPKLQTIIVKDFLNYPADLHTQLHGAEACIWALGTPTSGKEVHRDYTMTAVNACTGLGAKPFRFVYVSGGAVEKDQTKSVWILGKDRKMRGKVELELLGIGEKHAQDCQIIIARPWFVMKPGAWMGAIVPASHSISLPTLAAALVSLAINGDSKGLVENVDLRIRGAEVLKAQ